MGSEVSKKYDVEEKPAATAGLNGTWRIYNARTKATGEPVSMFMFDKAPLKGIPKAQREAVLALHRADVSTLKTLRHPRVLRVIEAFEENKSGIYFVAERIAATLANVSGDHAGFEARADIPNTLFDAVPSPFEVSVGLLHVAEALQFTHRDAKRLHMGISPWSIFVTDTGAWKLGGFGFSIPMGSGMHGETEDPYFAAFRTGKMASQAARRTLFPTTPSLRYCAPETTSSPGTVNSASDMFSLGCVAMELMGPRAADGSVPPFLEVADENPATHAFRVQNMPHPPPGAEHLPELLRPAILGMLSHMPGSRPDAPSFLRCEYFDRGPLHTLRSIETLLEQPRVKQSEFLAHLTPLLTPFPGRILRDMVAPMLLEFAKSPEMVGVVVPPLLVVADKVERPDFGRLLVPTLSAICNMPGLPKNATGVVIVKSHILVRQGDDGFVRDTLTPFVVRNCMSKYPEVCDVALKALPKLVPKLDSRTLIGVVTPQVLKIFQIAAAPTKIRVDALTCLASIMSGFDKNQITTTILPALLACIRMQPRDSQVAMAVVACYEEAAKLLGAVLAAVHVVPFLVPLLAEPKLDRAQLDAVAKVVHRMLGAVVSTRHKQMEDQATMTKEQRERADSERQARISEAIKADASQFERPTVRRPTEEMPTATPMFEPYKDPRAMEPTWGGGGGNAAAASDGGFGGGAAAAGGGLGGLGGFGLESFGGGGGGGGDGGGFGAGAGAGAGAGGGDLSGLGGWGQPDRRPSAASSGGGASDLFAGMGTGGGGIAGAASASSSMAPPPAPAPAAARAPAPASATTRTAHSASVAAPASTGGDMFAGLGVASAPAAASAAPRSASVSAATSSGGGFDFMGAGSASNAGLGLAAPAPVAQTTSAPASDDPFAGISTAPDPFAAAPAAPSAAPAAGMGLGIAGVAGADPAPPQGLSGFGFLTSAQAAAPSSSGQAAPGSTGQSGFSFMG